ncbi:hypothetical protein VNO78_05198 [Psophocarpus tetragonolobus]|uniref:Uncharacterized protein n=1 Tax=Psophocarpus tetragonolobus TaxID=3891 RepID=A0AAN9XRA5_PSOTE
MDPVNSFTQTACTEMDRKLQHRGYLNSLRSRTSNPHCKCTASCDHGQAHIIEWPRDASTDGRCSLTSI